MALPTTNLTVHCDAFDGDHVFEDDAGTDTAEDGDSIARWKDDDGKDLGLWHAYGSTTVPTFKTDVMVGSNAQFNGTDDFFQFFHDGGPNSVNPKQLIELMTLSAKTIIMSIYVEAATANNASAYTNHGIIADASELFGLFVKSGPKLILYNWDGNADTIQLNISLNTPYVVTVRHDGTNIYLGLDGGTETSAASGATTGNGNLYVGRSQSASFYAGRLGEIAIYNAVLTGTPLSDANAYFTSKWLAAAVVNDHRIIPPTLNFIQPAGQLAIVPATA